MKTLIISSSLNPDSNSYKLCREVEKRLQAEGVEVDFVDAREMELTHVHKENSASMEDLKAKSIAADNIIFGMAVYCYSVNDSLKTILDNCIKECEGKLFGILCAAGGHLSYLSTMHLTQICMNEWRMIQLPRVVYAVGSDFEGGKISDPITERLDQFAEEFYNIGTKLLS